MICQDVFVMVENRPHHREPESIGLGGTLCLYRDRVRIVAGRHEAVHQRRRRQGARGAATPPEPCAKRVAAVSGRRAQRSMRREHLNRAASTTTPLEDGRPRGTSASTKAAAPYRDLGDGHVGTRRRRGRMIGWSARASVR